MEFQVIETAYVPCRKTSMLAVNREGDPIPLEELDKWVEQIKNSVIKLTKGEVYEETDRIPPTQIIFKEQSSNKIIQLLDVVVNNLSYKNTIKVR